MMLHNTKSAAVMIGIVVMIIAIWACMSYTVSQSLTRAQLNLSNYSLLNSKIYDTNNEHSILDVSILFDGDLLIHDAKIKNMIADYRKELESFRLFIEKFRMRCERAKKLVGDFERYDKINTIIFPLLDIYSLSSSEKDFCESKIQYNEHKNQLAIIFNVMETEASVRKSQTFPGKSRGSDQINTSTSATPKFPDASVPSP